MKNILHKIIFASLFATLFATTVHAQPNTVQAIRVAVERQMQTYPKSTLQDLYKNFFQDNFGPGHIIKDTTAAGKYLDEELATYGNCQGADYEPTGYEGNFIRVNLSVIKSGRVPRNVYFGAFVRSVNSIQPISVEAWKTQWNQIDSVIFQMNLSLPNYENDRAKILLLLQQGKFVMHHSTLFNKNYKPHYRIIEKRIFETEILPLIKNEKIK